MQRSSLTMELECFPLTLSQSRLKNSSRRKGDKLTNLFFSGQEYTKRPRTTSSSNSTESVASQRYHPRHIVHPSNLSLQECLDISDVIISAVPSQTYKVKTEWLKDGCVCLNVAAEKNFEKDVRDKVRKLLACVFLLTRKHTHWLILVS